MSESCPSCAARVPAGASFCESCGAKLDASKTEFRRRPWILIGAGVVAITGLLAGAYFLGANAADDSAEVDELRERLAAISEKRNDAVVRAESAEEDADELSDEVERLNERLEAELSLAGKSAAQRDQTVSAADADLRLGEAGRVGDLLLRPTSFVKTGEGPEAAVWVVTITAKNDGNEPANPFCAGSGAEVEDSAGRRFGGDSIIGDTRNCGDDLQPGLSASNYKMRFKLPKEAQPVLLRLMDEFDESVRKTWAIAQ